MMDFAEILVLLAITGGATKAAAYFAAEGGHIPLPERRAIAIKAVVIQAIILSIFVAFGPNILKFFHVTIPALEVAGGLILLIFAIGLVLGEGHAESDGKPSAGAAMATYPLAVPLLAAPQAIVAVTIIATTLGAGNRAPLWAALATLVAANLVVMLIVAQIIGGDRKGDGSGGGVAAILLRIVALLLASLAVEIIALGLRGYGVLGAMPGAAH
jgi:multiple antibiotic resistance protein